MQGFQQQSKVLPSALYYSLSRLDRTTPRSWSDRPLPSWPSYRWSVPVAPKGPPGSDCSNASYQGEDCWTSKPDKNHPLFGGKSVIAHGWPWEAVIDLANEAGLSVWINVPAMATDDYIENLVRLVDERLHPDLNVMVEFSNEVWNVSPAVQHQIAYLPEP